MKRSILTTNSFNDWIYVRDVIHEWRESAIAIASEVKNLRELGSTK